MTATRGNHGQSIAIGAREVGIPALIVVPEGNSAEKNAAMEAFGGELLIAGRGFDEARQVAAREGAARQFLMVPPFHREIVKGVATYGWELLTEVPDLDAVFVPIGMGSGICALIAIRNLLGLKTEIIGVVAERAPAFALSYRARQPVTGSGVSTFADGVACCEPQEEPLAIILAGAADVVAVSKDEISEAIRVLYEATHNVAEGAGAAVPAGAIKLRERYMHKKIATVLTGGNIDRDIAARILAGHTPSAS